MKKGLLFIMLALIAGTGVVYKTQAGIYTEPCPGSCCLDHPSHNSKGYTWGPSCYTGCVPEGFVLNNRYWCLNPAGQVQWLDASLPDMPSKPTG